MKRRIFGFLTRLIVRPFMLKHPPLKKVAIIVPLSNRPELEPDEEISLRHLRYYLGRYDTYLVAPSESVVQVEGFSSKVFPSKFFGSAAAHNRLLSSSQFYRAFIDYEFIFFYHLDSLAFSDQLENWCKTNLDYIGPPWVVCNDTPWVKRSQVGNGGFTLLRVESALKVLSNRHRHEPITFWLDVFTHYTPLWLINGLEWIQMRFPDLRLVNRLLREWREVQNPTPHSRNNDLFWSMKAIKYLSNFKVATVEEGLRFAFEAAPRKCIESTGGEMPFGCHAWGRYDRAFWEPYLLNE